MTKGLFIIYMVMVALLLINMLIAMMANTYETVSNQKNEWMRQWAKIIVIIEQGIHVLKFLYGPQKYITAHAINKHEKDICMPQK